MGDFPGSPVYPGFPDAAGDLWFGDDSGSGADDGAQVFRNPVIGNYAGCRIFTNWGTLSASSIPMIPDRDLLERRFRQIVATSNFPS